MTKTTASVSREGTPTPPVTKKKKSSKKNDLKWFKGSTNKTRTPKKLLKHAQKESSPQQLPIPARVVEFDIDGHTERLGVSEILSMLDKGNTNYDLPQTPDTADDSSNSAFPNSPFPGTPLPSTSKRGKGKGTLKQPKHGRTPKITTNPNNNWSISENSESNSNSLNNKLPEGKFSIMDDHKPRVASPMPNSYIRYMEKRPEELENEVEYDIDEEDIAWLELVNEKRRASKLMPVLPESMEYLLDRLEKESYFQMQSTGMEQTPLIDDDAVCCICMDGECQNSNAILFCDMCNLAVHQECYGVPYIPEGQWLCRRCLQSPSRAVDCALCPNKGGAFKQTDDGRWAHVICAIWIPEVCFANTVFLEPIDSVNNIPAARWRLCCYICKQKGVGACIQCQKSNCYTAFHVTCAQQANLCMKMDTVVEGNAVIVKKIAYCDHHAPPENERGDDSPRQKLKQTRKLLAEKRCALPVVSIPTIPNDRIDEIAKNVDFSRKHQFIKRLMAYWKLKRQQRNGVPLLRRLQAASSLPSTSTKRDESRSIGSTEVTSTLNYYQYWVRMRQDLEKARLLCELIRKRERLKRTFIHVRHQETNLTLKPFNTILLNVIEELMARDVSEIFCEPVDTNEVVDYLNLIKKPMDLSTMKSKAESFEYLSIDEVEEDFDLMIRNCLAYNGRDTIYYKAGLRLRELGGVVIRQARRLINSIGFDKVTGMHLENRVSELPVLEDSEILEKVEKFMENEERFKLPMEKHIEELQNLMDETLALTHPLKRKNRFSRVRNELIRLRKLKHYKEDPSRNFKEYMDSKHNSLFLTDADPSSPPLLNCDPAIELFRVGVSPARRAEPMSEGTKYETRNPAPERSKNRLLRPIKRKILKDSPLKDSPIKEPPTPPSSKRAARTLKRKTSNSTRSSVSPTRKSQRINNAQESLSQLQIEVPGMRTPTKSSVSPANQQTPTAKSHDKKGSTSEFVSPASKTPGSERKPKGKKNQKSSEPMGSPAHSELRRILESNNSLDHANPNCNDRDSGQAQPVSRTLSRSPSVSSSGSSISSLIRFDAPDFRFDRFGTQHEPGTIPIIVSPTRPIEVITTYSSNNNSEMLSPNNKVLVPVEKGNKIAYLPGQSYDVNYTDSSAHDNTSSTSPSRSSTLPNSDTTNNALNSVSKKAGSKTVNSAKRKYNKMKTPESKQKESGKKKGKALLSSSKTPKSSTPAKKLSTSRRIISFTSPSPLKKSPVKSTSKSPKSKSVVGTKKVKKLDPEKLTEKASKSLKKLSPEKEGNKKESPKKKKADKLSPKATEKAMNPPKTNKPAKQGTLSPFLHNTTTLLLSTEKDSSPKKAHKSGTSRSNSPTKTPKTPNKVEVKKRLSSTEDSPTKQKKAKMITSSRTRLSRSLSHNEVRHQSRSPSITSLTVREPCGGLKNRTHPQPNLKPAEATKTNFASDVDSKTFKQYGPGTATEMHSNSNDDHNVRNSVDEREDDGKNPRKEKAALNTVNQKGISNELEAQNGTSEALSDSKTHDKATPSKYVKQRVESPPKECKLSLTSLNSLSAPTSNNNTPQPKTDAELNVLADVNTNERVGPPQTPSPSSESDLLDLSDEEDVQLSSRIFSRFENFSPKPLDLVWAVYEFKSWFPAMVINPDGPFGQVHPDGFKIHQPPAEVLIKKPNTDQTVFLVSYFELKHHWKWVERNQLKPLGSDSEVDKFLLAAKSILDLREVKKAYERAILHRCRVHQNEEEDGDDDPNGELLDLP